MVDSGVATLLPTNRGYIQCVMLLDILLLLTVRFPSIFPVDLHIGGVFPMEASFGGWAGGQACLPAVQMALRDVNENREVLNGYNLVLHHHNSKCQPGLAAKQLYELLYKPPVKLILLAGCSPVTTIIAEAAPVWNLLVLSYGGSSPALSNRQRFPTLFRTHPTANLQNPTRIRLFQKFKWKRLTVLQSVEEVFTSTAKDLENKCRDNGIKLDRQSFYGDPTDAIKTLVRQDARIIVGLFYAVEARRVLCQAYKHRLYGKKYVWFFIGWYTDTWFIPPPEEALNCTANQMITAAQYHITTESIMLSLDQQKTISGMTGLEFQQKLLDLIKTDPANTGGFLEAPLAYDAVWAIALALNCTISKLSASEALENFMYNNTVIAKELFGCVKNTQFKGVSGPVMFSDSGDRIARTQIEQLQDSKYEVLGTYDTTTSHLDWYSKEKFATDNGLPPPDSTIIKESYLTVDIELYYAVAVFVVVGIILSLVAWIFNLRNSSQSVIIQSQPRCNNLFIAGCILCSLSLFLMGIPVEGYIVPKGSFTLLCHSRISILMIGFTFAYGSMFAKVWIVHRMGAKENQKLANHRKSEESHRPAQSSVWVSARFVIGMLSGQHVSVPPRFGSTSAKCFQKTESSTRSFLDEPIAAKKFYWVVAIFFSIDLFIIICWLIFDPMQRKEQIFPLQAPQPGIDNDIKLLPISEFCESKRHEIWTGIIMGYKCLLLVLGLFLAYETRNFKVRYLNDSRFVGLAIYNVTILSLVTGPVVTLLIRSQNNANFAFIAVTVLLCIYISLGLIFIPKVQNLNQLITRADRDSAIALETSSTVTASERKRIDELTKENLRLKNEVDLTEDKIRKVREKISKLIIGDKHTTNLSDGLASFTLIPSLTTTALVEPDSESHDDDNSDRMRKYDHLVDVEMPGSSFEEVFL